MTSMEMIIVKDVKAGDEVFNTYGSLGNAALLHRYGFTEPDNPFDILNIDLDIVVQWSLSLFSCCHSRRRLSLWRKLDYSGCVSQDSEYFEISFHGEPQVELLVLLCIMLLLEDEFHELELSLSATGEVKETLRLCLLGKESSLSTKDSRQRTKLLLTESVRRALCSLADARESLYGPNSLEDDIRSFNECCRATDPKLYYSLILRIRWNVGNCEGDLNEETIGEGMSFTVPVATSLVFACVLTWTLHTCRCILFLTGEFVSEFHNGWLRNKEK
ncbi:hypothetical protein CDL12_14506 [Handroanthus impetiginosus]|uniref:SET domain-containing protein n=1 Tax=Handroanthus impetiginosus TaxID=429701 RepID=A0A2G9H5T8_9LAMI|nr:hypothetical protein CDL12_14506 [Handroanthus impetiginosus]